MLRHIPDHIPTLGYAMTTATFRTFTLLRKSQISFLLLTDALHQAVKKYLQVFGGEVRTVGVDKIDYEIEELY